jgi:hypothetical protein
MVDGRLILIWTAMPGEPANEQGSPEQLRAEADAIEKIIEPHEAGEGSDPGRVSSSITVAFEEDRFPPD